MKIFQKRGVIEHLLPDWPIALHIKIILLSPNLSKAVLNDIIHDDVSILTSKYVEK